MDVFLDRTRNFLRAWGLPVLLGMLNFFWPIPHTIALRHGLLMAAIVLPILLGARLSWHKYGSFFAWFLVLTTWFAAQAIFISPEPEWAFREIRGQWLPALLALTAGVLATELKFLSPERIAAAIFLALTVHVLSTVTMGLWPLLSGQSLVRRVAGLTEGPDKSNYLTLMFFAWLAAESYGRAVAARPSLPWSPAWFLFGIPVAFLAFYMEQMRNVIFSIAGIVVVFALAAGTNPRFRTIVWFLVCGVIAVTAFLAAQDPRWQHFESAVRFAMQSDTRAVVTGAAAMPTKLPDGSPLEVSAYLRFAMAKEALQLIAEHPWGVGFGRNAFGHALKKAYGAGSGHAHSSFLDLALGVGIVGVLLFSACLFWLIAQGLKALKHDRKSVGLVLALVVASFAARMVVDSNVRDHMFAQFLFMTGFLYAWSRREDST